MTTPDPDAQELSDILQEHREMVLLLQKVKTAIDDYWIGLATINYLFVVGDEINAWLDAHQPREEK